MSQETVGNNTMAPAGQLTYKQIFYRLNVDPSDKPRGLEIMFDGAQLARDTSKPQFTTSRYDFQFNLGCVETGATANAEGESNEIHASAGCMNQWMSNGVWKVRATAISPFPPDQKPDNQIGWRVTQT